MADDQPLMVLRSFYLPPDMDEALRNIAFTEHRTKADVIRQFIEAGLQQYDTTRYGSGILAYTPSKALDTFAKAEAAGLGGDIAAARAALASETG